MILPRLYLLIEQKSENFCAEATMIELTTYLYIIYSEPRH